MSSHTYFSVFSLNVEKKLQCNESIVCNILNKYNISVMLIQDTGKCSNFYVFEKLGYEVKFTPPLANDKAGGLATIFHNSLSNCVTQVISECSRVQAWSLKWNKTYSIYNIYHKSGNKSTFNFIKNIPYNDCCLMGGDFNSVASIYMDKITVGKVKSNLQLVKSLIDNGFVDFFRWCHPDTSAYTRWGTITTGKGKALSASRLDYILGGDEWTKKVINCEILNNLCVDSDHYLVVATFNILNNITQNKSVVYKRVELDKKKNWIK